MYSVEVNGWIVDAARHVLSQEHFDLVYLTTTDYAMHTYGPDHSEAARHVALLDDAIGKLMDSLPDVEFLLTADHGMSAKSRMIHLPAVLAEHGIKAHAVPIIKDLYTVHHSNLGGCITFTWMTPICPPHWMRCAVPTVWTRRCLMEQRIGDIMVMGGPEVVFGNPDEVEMPAGLRSHGSLYEDDVPIIGCGGSYEGFDFHENRDVGRYIFERVLV